MMQYKVIFTPEALGQLTSLYRYIALAASPEIAERYEPIRTRYAQILMDLMQASLDVANHRSPKKGIEVMLSGLHDLDTSVVELQKELGRLAHRHDL